MDNRLALVLSAILLILAIVLNYKTLKTQAKELLALLKESLQMDLSVETLDDPDKDPQESLRD